MWIITQVPSSASPSSSQEERERILDLLLQISPDIFLADKAWNDEEPLIFIHLHKVQQYWKLADWGQAGHALQKLLETLAERENLHFTLAPSAPWAYFHDRLSEKKERVTFHSPADCQECLQHIPLVLLSHFIVDLVCERSGSMRSEWHYFVESLEALGLKQVMPFLRFCQHPLQLEQMGERLGPLPKKIFHRLLFKDDFPLKVYQPSPHFQQRFYPDLERQITAPVKLDILERLRAILEEWEERLRLRKSLIKGFEVTLSANRGRCQRRLCLSLPRPTRQAASLFKLLSEKWMASTHHFVEEDLDLRSLVFEEVKITSLGLQFESDRQLHLFDPKREDREEEWNLLVATLCSLGSDVRVGHYAAHASYWPEFSVEWRQWSDSDVIAFVEEHPPRPLLLYSPPKTFSTPELQTENDFLQFLAEHQALPTLEKICDPWRGEERSYARIQKEWLFWDHKKSRCFVHGLFPEL